MSEQLHGSMNAPPDEAGFGSPGREFGVLGTPLLASSYGDLIAWCHRRTRQPGSTALEFTNTHIVTLRRKSRRFRDLTRGYDYFVPDATPLVWCLNARGAGLRDRVYGPIFMRKCLVSSGRDCTHYLLGGSGECAEKLKKNLLGLNGDLRFVGGFHGRCAPDGVLEGEADARVLTEINDLSPDFVWVGLGTPKQDAWLRRNKDKIRRGIILSVGFAFDVNAGTKPDAPMWMQRSGLTWLFRLVSEPRRLSGRYLKYNSLFLWYLCTDGLRGRAFATSFPDEPVREPPSDGEGSA